MLKPILFSIALSLSLSTFANTEDKGLDVCLDANSDNCIITSINQKINQDDVRIQFKYSDANGDGKAHSLENNQTLHSGEKFTVEIEAKQDLYVYLFHFDVHKQLNELLNVSGKSNQLKAGERALLPSAMHHFKLDDKVGLETIHTVVSTKPLTELYAAYEQKIKGETVTAIVSQGGEKVLEKIAAKGIIIEADKISEAVTVYDKPALNVIEKSEPDAGRTLVCLAEKAACRDSFVIKHVK